MKGKRAVSGRSAPSLPKWLDRRQTRRDLLLGGAGGFVAALAWAQFKRQRGGLEITPRTRGRVTAVEHGPRLRVRIEGFDDPVEFALLGVAFEATQREPAERWLRQQAAGREVVIGFDPGAQRRDGSGCLRGYVYLGGEMLNEQLIARGLGQADESEAYELREWFERVAWRARRGKSGGRGRPNVAAGGG
jgi:hypothetical protein